MGKNKAIAVAQRPTPKVLEFCDTLAPLLRLDVAAETCERAIEDTFRVRYEIEIDEDYGD